MQHVPKSSCKRTNSKIWPPRFSNRRLDESFIEQGSPMDPILEETKGPIKVERKKTTPPNFSTPTSKSKILNLKTLCLSPWFVLEIDAIRELLQSKEFFEHMKTKIENLSAKRSDLEGQHSQVEYATKDMRLMH